MPKNIEVAQSQVAQEISYLEVALSCLEDNMARLENRITPALAPVDGTKATDTPRKVHDVPLIDALQSIKSRIDRISQHALLLGDRSTL